MGINKDGAELLRMKEDVAYQCTKVLRHSVTLVLFRGKASGTILAARPAKLPRFFLAGFQSKG